MQQTKKIVDLPAAEGAPWDGAERPIDHMLAAHDELDAARMYVQRELAATVARLDAEFDRRLAAVGDQLERATRVLDAADDARRGQSDYEQAA